MVHFFAYLYTDIVYIFYTKIYAYVCLFMYSKKCVYIKIIFYVSLTCVSLIWCPNFLTEPTSTYATKKQEGHWLSTVGATQ